MSNEKLEGDDGANGNGADDNTALSPGKLVRTFSEEAFKDFGDASRMDDFEEVKELGRGGFGVVTLVRRKEDGKMLVIKKLEFEVMSKEDIRDAMNEVKLLRQVSDHPNVTRYIESFVMEDGFCIVQEYCELGNLAERLTNWYHADGAKEEVGEAEVLLIFCQLAQAVAHIHDQNVLHRDLKPANVMLTRWEDDAAPPAEDAAADGGDDDDMMDDGGGGPVTVVKLGDFGLSRELQGNRKAQTYCGTTHYLSPEVVEGRPYDNKSDIWALGCCLYEMLMGQKPFKPEATTKNELLLAIAQGDYERVPKERCNAQLRKLVERCLSYMPEERPSVHEILEVGCVRRAANEHRDRLGLQPLGMLERTNSTLSEKDMVADTGYKVSEIEL